jgi:hypothetical protein
VNVCGLCERELEHGHLCPGDTLALAERLEQLPALYAEVSQHLVPRHIGWGEIVSTKGAAGPRSPINEDVLDLVDFGGAARVLESRRVDVQHVRWPDRGAPPPAGMAATCRWLAMELDWIVDQYPDAGDLAREVRELERQARTIVGDPVPRRQRIGTCIAATGEDTVCGAVLSRLPGEELRCRWCGTAYRTEQEILLLHHFQPKQPA